MSSVQELESKVKEMNKKISDLENVVKSLKSEILNKDIIIDALVTKLREKVSVERIINVDEETDVERVSMERANMERANVEEKVDVKRIKKNTEEMSLPGLGDFPDELNEKDSINHKTVSETYNTHYLGSPELIIQIKDIFVQKSKNIDFKTNYTFKKFVDYAEMSYEFSLFNKKIFRIKNPLKQFLDANLDRIIKFIIENINFFNMNQICSTLFLINSEIPYKQKLVIFHDIILELENFSKLNFIASALFNNVDLESDFFSQLIKKIMYHQICVDTKLITDTDIHEYYSIIRDNFTLTPPDISLWDSLSHFLVSHTLFDSAKKTVKPESIEKGFALRTLCTYLDWDYTFNTFIRTQLHPKILSDRSPIHVYYMGILMMNARRFFGFCESVSVIEGELREILEWKDQCSVVVYLILKQLYSEDCELWICENEKTIENIGFDVNYLKTFFLL